MRIARRFRVAPPHPGVEAGHELAKIKTFHDGDIRWLEDDGNATPSPGLLTVEEQLLLAQEIHDTLAQGFSSIVMQLEAAEELLLADLEFFANASIGSRRAL